MKAGLKGFQIKCAHCRKEFDGLGLRSCSIECERALKERKDNLAFMAEIGMEPSVTKRHCEICGAKRAVVPVSGRNCRHCTRRLLPDDRQVAGLMFIGVT